MSTPDSPAEDATEILGQPVTGDVRLDASASVGPYVIRRVLGEGGMGCVYLAEQVRPVRREVALKVIRGQVASPLARAYFDVERQALAQMQHPAIAQVFDAGTTDDGRPYLAMELVEGQPITDFCRDHGLDRRQRLALFARVCHGVQHAHQKGIIHRDLKPANVLVRRIDGQPMPKIIDFGVAIGGSAGDETVRAQVADRAGTAIYMSPEQAGLRYRDLDTRSDVYSLGVMLYEVLTDADATAMTSAGHRSAHRTAHQTLLAAIDTDPDTMDADAAADVLHHAARELPAELRAILRKALAPDRADRYDSAAALADDLERHAGRRPVKALPQTRLYLTRCFLARHKLGLIAASLAAAALLAGTALALHGLAQARMEARKASQVADFVRSILAGIDPNRAMGLDRSLMRLVLDSAAERASHELADQPDVHALIEDTIANSYASLGEYADATTHFSAAAAAARHAGMPAPQIARFEIDAASNVNTSGHAKQALDAAQQAFARVAGLPPDDRDRLYVESMLATIEGNAGRLADARERLLRVVGAQRHALGDDDPETLESMRSLANIDSNMARYDEARPLLREVIEAYTRLHGADHSTTLNAVNDLAVVELEQKHYAAAERLLKPQLATNERLYGADHPATLIVVGNLGGAIRQQGRNEEARPYYERAFEGWRKRNGPTSPASVSSETNLALLLRDAGQLDAAERHARSAASNADVAFGDNAYRAIIHREYATILTLLGRYADAERELEGAWKVISEAKGYGPGHPRSQDVIDSFVGLYTRWNKPDLAAQWRARKAALAQGGA
jgi:non-specific serine/threonine protein kinase/serine/threonine-protein kinase